LLLQIDVLLEDVKIIEFILFISCTIIIFGCIVFM